MTDTQQASMNQVTADRANFEQAVALHRAGRLHDAELGYRRELQRDPNNSDALHLLGVIAHQAGNTQAAIELIERAIFIRAEPTYLANIAEIYRAAGQTDRGIAACQRAIAAAPNLAVAYINLAPLMDEVGKRPEALAAAQKAVQLDPGNSAGRRVLGLQLLKAGRVPDSMVQCNEGIRLNPSDAATWIVLSECQEKSGLVQAALESASKAVQLAPNMSQAYNAIGRMLCWSQRRPIDALPYFEKAVQIDPKDLSSAENLARCLEKMDRFDDAIRFCQQVMASRPVSAGLIGALGWSYINAGRPEEAETLLSNAVTQLNNADLHQTRAVGLTRLGRNDDALASINRALALDPEACLPNFSKALIYLFSGRLPEAWPLFEWRWKHPLMDAWRPGKDFPLWDGSPLNGKRILLFGEQGLGDTIHFARYAKDVAGRGGVVVLQVQRGLDGLMRTVPGVSEVVSRDEPTPVCDLQCPLLSLPGIFGTTLQNITVEVPYIKVDPQRQQKWKSIIGDGGGKFKVGLAFEGSAFQRENNLRSLKLQQLAVLAQVPNVRFYSMQKGSGSQQAAIPPAGMDLVNLDPLIGDFTDTAAAIECMDLMITIDTAVLHVVGALGLPCWVLLGRFLGHMWFGDGEVTPWYPTVKLYRQPKPCDWDSVLKKMTDDLRALVESRKQ